MVGLVLVVKLLCTLLGFVGSFCKDKIWKFQEATEKRGREIIVGQIPGSDSVAQVQNFGPGPESGMRNVAKIDSMRV
jgi:hypothetical protein